MIECTLKNIHASFESFEQLIDLYDSNKNLSFETIEISFQEWFGANMSAVLGGILDKLNLNLNTIHIKNIPQEIEAIIRKNGFLTHYGFIKKEDSHNTTIPYLKLSPRDGKYFYHYIFEDLINRPEFPEMSIPLKKKIAESIYELFANAKMHSESEFIYTCGQYFPKKNFIEFTITDTGIGFKEKIYRRFNKQMTSIDSIRWAVASGHTTKIGISGGIGLSILKEFVEKNKGKIQIISDTGFYQFDSNGEYYKYFSKPFPGSVINVQFRTDDSQSYSLLDEDSDDIF
jgi:hypothetical protein